MLELSLNSSWTFLGDKILNSSFMVVFLGLLLSTYHTCHFQLLHSRSRPLSLAASFLLQGPSSCRTTALPTPPRFLLSLMLYLNLSVWPVLPLIAMHRAVHSRHRYLLKELLVDHFFLFFFYVKEREWCDNPLVYEHNPNKRNTPNSNPHQQIHRGLSEHCGRLWSWQLPRSKPRLEVCMHI